MLAVITGANTGMGYEITRSVAKAGYDVIMACYDVSLGEKAREELVKDTGNDGLEVMGLDLCDLANVAAFADKIIQRGERIDLLMNNAGSLQDRRLITKDGIEHNVSVNYVGPYLLTRKLIPLMGEGSRIVNMASLVYKFGHINMDTFLTQGCNGSYNRFSVYSNSKLAITLFTLNLAQRLKDKGITVNASDPWIASTDIIRMNNKVVDTLCDAIFRPIIYTPAKGAATAIDLLLNPAKEGVTGTFNKNCHEVKLRGKYRNHPLMQPLWDAAEKLVEKYL